MRDFRCREALARHPEVNDTLVRVTDLMEHFRTGNSMARLLRRMGPFKVDPDAFLFKNRFGINAEQAEDFLNTLTDAVIDGVIERVIGQYIGKLKGIDINPLPGFETHLPDEVIDFVEGRLYSELYARIIDLIAPPIDPDFVEFGRCGGMAFAGYDFYLSGIPIDTSVKDPPIETPLGNYIYDRLLDSLLLNIGTFLEWKVTLKLGSFLNAVARAALAAAVAIVLPPIGALILAYLAATTDIFEFPSGGEMVLESTKDEWTKLKGILDQQAAWPVGLVRYYKSPWKDHQVLAIGYTDDGAGQGSLLVWENIDGPIQRTITLDFTGNELKASGPYGRNKNYSNLRGFFADKYSTQGPPDDLAP